jgi:hypothetical protein
MFLECLDGDNKSIIMKNLILVVALFFIGFSAQAQVKKNKNAKHEIAVSGNCEQCQIRIQNAAYLVRGVKSAIWSVETNQLSLILNEEKTTITDVKKAVAKAGHDVDEFKTDDQTYENLPGCCQYERK